MNLTILQSELRFHQQVSECYASCALSGSTEAARSVISPKTLGEKCLGFQEGTLFRIKDCSVEL